MFEGSIVALITPFKGNGLDEDKIRELVNWHVKQGTSGIVPVGTTGESPTLSHEEHRRVIEIVIEEARGRVKVIAGTGSNSTQEAISLTQHAAEAGADGALMITPYYNKPGQKGIYEHFKKVSQKVDIPIVLYNHIGRTGISIEPATVEALSKTGRFVAVKDASGGINYSAEILERTGGKVAILSGNDTWTPALMALGASGCISVVANILPKKHAQMIAAFLKSDYKKGRKLYYDILPAMKAMELDVNPVPVKAAMGMMGMASASLRLPLVALGKENKAAMRKTLKSYGLIK
ncbi:MAG TPA: 4-hydroxy-tetrahydrodipicolinate synthase [bacterium]|nr:4-hydroxy-tetrahydrodipicolinate synthase [bacterium]